MRVTCREVQGVRMVEHKRREQEATTTHTSGRVRDAARTVTTCLKSIYSKPPLRVYKADFTLNCKFPHTFFATLIPKTTALLTLRHWWS